MHVNLRPHPDLSRAESAFLWRALMNNVTTRHPLRVYVESGVYGCGWRLSVVFPDLGVYSARRYSVDFHEAVAAAVSEARQTLADHT